MVSFKQKWTKRKIGKTQHSCKRLPAGKAWNNNNNNSNVQQVNLSSGCQQIQWYANPNKFLFVKQMSLSKAVTAQGGSSPGNKFFLLSLQIHLLRFLAGFVYITKGKAERQLTKDFVKVSLDKPIDQKDYKKWKRIRMKNITAIFCQNMTNTVRHEWYNLDK